MENTCINKDGVAVVRQKCQVYTRVMGYLRPVSHYNLGKKSEFYSRKYFKNTIESEYVRSYETAKIMYCPSGFVENYKEKIEKMLQMKLQN